MKNMQKIKEFFNKNKYKVAFYLIVISLLLLCLAFFTDEFLYLYNNYHAIVTNSLEYNISGKKISQSLDSFNHLSLIIGTLTLFFAFFAYRGVKKQINYQKDQIKMMHEEAIKNDISRAWEIIGRRAAGNSGKKEALETLAKHNVPLVGINMSAEHHGGSVYLAGLNLTGVNLTGADFSGAHLSNASFTNCFIIETNFSKTHIVNAKFNNNTQGNNNFHRSFLCNTKFVSGIFENNNLNESYLGRSSFANLRISDIDLSKIDKNANPIFKDCYTSIHTNKELQFKYNPEQFTIEIDKSKKYELVNKNKQEILQEDSNGEYYKLDIKAITQETEE